MVRRGLDPWVAGRGVGAVRVLHPRAVRRHAAGGGDFTARLAGRTIDGVARRGKYLWLPLDSGEALLAHLGMSGQLLVKTPDADAERHLRVRLDLETGGNGVRFVDQRTFGHLMVAPLAADDAGAALPTPIAHIARDPVDPLFDDDAFSTALRRRRTGLKRALLDQSLISGIGNIYADEALWRAELHWARPTETLRTAQVAAVLAAVRAVLAEALDAGGTSFDSLYVNVNGESGYFERGLQAYGRRDRPCARCGAPIRREVFMNRSSYSCPRCQPAPRRARY
ncbi:DNA-(apurinic or apyrimidinic site) lyase [Murinocardiopsis flavida]|uniref:DNA-(Apurinic or apyrimidinic site) lyase n=1 Tax=Murinocardiopsis flavida TaxID=645275 RepID=A0A2P8DEH5_9ACTN|nr:DNA-(apurinic or apyrimidinic site) lyase [Murinocardiopsis flavida]